MHNKNKASSALICEYDIMAKFDCNRKSPFSTDIKTTSFCIVQHLQIQIFFFECSAPLRHRFYLDNSQSRLCKRLHFAKIQQPPPCNRPLRTNIAGGHGSPHGRLPLISSSVFHVPAQKGKATVWASLYSASPAAAGLSLMNSTSPSRSPPKGSARPQWPSGGHCCRIPGSGALDRHIGRCGGSP